MKTKYQIPNWAKKACGMPIFVPPTNPQRHEDVVSPRRAKIEARWAKKKALQSQMLTAKDPNKTGLNDPRMQPGETRTSKS